MAHHARCTPPRKANYRSFDGVARRGMNLDLRNTPLYSLPKCYRDRYFYGAVLVIGVGNDYAYGVRD